MSKQIKISEILNLLDNGYVRYVADEGLTENNEKDGKSIQSYYGLPASRIKEIFQHPKLRHKVTNRYVFELIDDTEEEEVSTENEASIENEVSTEEPINVDSSDEQENSLPIFSI